jgi:hypothetical protein
MTKMQMGVTPQSGILIRGASGQLWLMLDTDKEPTAIQGKARDEILRHFETLEGEGFVGHVLPKSIGEILIKEELVIPDIGLWWVWGPGT